MSKRIAIVEDELAIRENYASAFRREGYSVELYEARQPAIDAFDARLPDLVVIDINLKDEVEGGFELCRALRSRSADLPIIFLTARDSEFDAVSGLRLGADDYLTKDISLPHLMARIAALFRRLDVLAKPSSGETRLRRGGLELDVDRMTVRWLDHPVALTLTEFWMVHALARYPGHVKNRQQLMDAAQAVLDEAREDEYTQAELAQMIDPKLVANNLPGPGIQYLGAWYVIGPDEAIKIEGRDVPCRYWSCQILSRYLESGDYRHHRVGINNRQVKLGADGAFVIYACHENPGVENWVCTQGYGNAHILIRTLLADPPMEATFSVVKIDDIEGVRP